MALSKLAANSFDLTDNYSFTGTVSGAGISTQKLFLIKNLDASGSSTRTFIDGSNSVVLDNTYKTYYFKFINIHASGSTGDLVFQGSTQGASSSDSDYANNITSNVFQSAHSEDDSTNAEIGYTTSADQGNGTGFQIISATVGNGNDECVSGEMWLFNPSSTTFVKHFMARTNVYHPSDISVERWTAGYFNTTSAINAIRFKLSAGNMDSGRIALYGIK